MMSGRAVRRALDAAKRRFPRTYWRGRNAVALAVWCLPALGARGSSGTGNDAYDDEFWAFHEVGDWDRFARLVLDESAVQSVVDVGCGDGRVLAAFAREAPSLTLLGFDASQTALERARQRGVTVERLNVVALSEAQVRALAARIERFDLVLCLEVAEHMPAWHSEKLLALVTAADRVVFSAAHPNQGGRLHVNEQPAIYWIERFRRRGFRLADSDGHFRTVLGGLSLPSWYAENVHVFERESEPRRSRTTT
jgi:SAM-dependent methyltransferase